LRVDVPTFELFDRARDKNQNLDNSQQRTYKLL